MNHTKELHISSSPHIREQRAVPEIMRDVAIALAPAVIASVYFFGWRSLIIILVAVFTAIGSEHFISKVLLKRQSTIGDWSAVVTAILVAFNFPVGAPLLMVVEGTLFAIVVAKWAFGGLGANFINPALAGRAFVLGNHGSAMTGAGFNAEPALATLPEPLCAIPDSVILKDPNFIRWAEDSAAFIPQKIDAITTATPLANTGDLLSINTADTVLQQGLDISHSVQAALPNLLLGNCGGVIGETSTVALLIGALYLLIRRVINLTVPLTYIGSVFALYLLSTAFDTGFTKEPLIMGTYHILAGGLMLGAFFMATDMVTSPITQKGQILFALGCGGLTFVIREFGGYPEGVSYSILLMNLAVPLIDRYIKPRVYGTGGTK